MKGTIYGNRLPWSRRVKKRWKPVIKEDQRPLLGWWYKFGMSGVRTYIIEDQIHLAHYSLVGFIIIINVVNFTYMDLLFCTIYF
jgi:hypothetical protein